MLSILWFSQGTTKHVGFFWGCDAGLPIRPQLRTQELFEERWAASGLEPKVEQEPKAKQSEEKAAPSGERGALVILGKLLF